MYIVLPISQCKHTLLKFGVICNRNWIHHIKNWFTFINFNLFNQGIVKSQATMTVNFEKSEPKHAHVKTNLIGQCNIVTPFLVYKESVQTRYDITETNN